MVLEAVLQHITKAGNRDCKIVGVTCFNQHCSGTDHHSDIWSYLK